MLVEDPTSVGMAIKSSKQLLFKQTIQSSLREDGSTLSVPGSVLLPVCREWKWLLPWVKQTLQSTRIPKPSGITDSCHVPLALVI